MSYKTILVHVETGAKAERRLALAAGLADRFGARLIGLTVVLPPTWGGVAGLPQLIADIEKSNEDFIVACRTLFQQATASRPEESEFHYHVGMVRDVLTEESAFSDLVVVGETAGESEEEESILTADDALFASAAPVLVVPHGFDQTFEPKTVFIAWKPTREAARAVRDALPILHGVAKIVVGVVAATDGSAARHDDIGVYLGRHGLHVEIRAVEAEGSVGRTIIGLAEAAGADLIVAGGYGHAPLREWLMGGVTEALLHDCPVPCLMSH